MDFLDLDVKQLLCLQSAVTDELKRREVVRTRNNPLGDYSEWLVAKALDLTLLASSSAGYDACDKDGKRIQIKARRISTENKSRQLGVIRNYDLKDFDQLAAVIFSAEYDIIDAVIMPHEVVGDYASYRPHVNGHILHLRGPILTDHRVISIRTKLVDVRF